MSQKFKDYYDYSYCEELAEKFTRVYPDFDTKKFIEQLTDLENLAFNDRQVLIAEALKASLPLSYEETIAVFTKILGPELKGSLGMFTEGYWLWPLGKYVELYGTVNFAVSTEFAKELTKRFTGEFAMRPLIQAQPKKAMDLLITWSTDDNQRVRRLASECIRIRLPWAKKMTIALDYFPEYTEILTNLKDDPDKSIQKSVANNLNDLYKEDPEKFSEIISAWSTTDLSKATAWIIHHASRTKRKAEQAKS
ncbi:DNA alkylation repair protein [Enterococcus sp. LJL90]